MTAETPTAEHEETAAASPESANSDDRPVVFFDGVCGMCNKTVDFILARDRRQQFLFAPLQGETARKELSAKDTENLSSMVLQTNGKQYRASSAVSRMLWRLGGFWRVLGALLWLVPWPLRHLGYKLVAANRYRFFGKKDACRMPTAEERSRFLP